MKIIGKDFRIMQIISLALYYGIARHLPKSQNMLMGGCKSENSFYALQTNF